MTRRYGNPWGPFSWLRRYLVACLLIAPFTALLVIGINSGWW